MANTENYWMWAAIVIGLVVIVLLVRQIRVSLQTLKQARQKQHELALPVTEYLRQSLYVLARSIMDDQVELSEACIRIKVLLDNFNPDWHAEAVLSIFSKMYDDTAHMPTHQARKDTDKRFIHKLDQQRFRLEREHREAIRQAAQELLRRIEIRP